ncbi:hypothetical protein QTP88_007215 [Uroleucon formosanum]
MLVNNYLICCQLICKVKSFFLVNKNLKTEEDSTDIKSFIITDNDEEETHEETEETEKTEEPEYTVSNYSEVLTQIKQLSAFTLQKDSLVQVDETVNTTPVKQTKNLKENNCNEIDSDSSNSSILCNHSPSTNNSYELSLERILLRNVIITYIEENGTGWRDLLWSSVHRASAHRNRISNYRPATAVLQMFATAHPRFLIS